MEAETKTLEHDLMHSGVYGRFYMDLLYGPYQVRDISFKDGKITGRVVGIPARIRDVSMSLSKHRSDSRAPRGLVQYIHHQFQSEFKVD